MSIPNYRNAVFIDRIIDSDRSIDCEIDHPNWGWIPFTVCKHDTGSDIDTSGLYDKIINDDNILPYVPPSEDELLLEASLSARQERQFLLETNVDPLVSNQLRWNDLSTEQQTNIIAYRQALLDITDQPDFPYNIQWPVL